MQTLCGNGNVSADSFKRKRSMKFLKTIKPNPAFFVQMGHKLKIEYRGCFVDIEPIRPMNVTKVSVFDVGKFIRADLKCDDGYFVSVLASTKPKESAASHG